MQKITNASTQAIVSSLVLIAFALIAVLSFTKVVPASNVSVQYVLTTLGTLATTVVSYWVGSSAGSAAKTQLLAGNPLPGVAPVAPQTMPPLSGPKQ